MLVDIRGLALPEPRRPGLRGPAGRDALRRWDVHVYIYIYREREIHIYIYIEREREIDIYIDR